MERFGVRNRDMASSAVELCRLVGKCSLLECYSLILSVSTRWDGVLRIAGEFPARDRTIRRGAGSRRKENGGHQQRDFKAAHRNPLGRRGETTCQSTPVVIPS